MKHVLSIDTMYAWGANDPVSVAKTYLKVDKKVELIYTGFLAFRDLVGLQLFGLFLFLLRRGHT